MKFLILLLTLTFGFNISAQNDFSKEDAIAIVDTFFDGFHKADSLIMNSVVSGCVIF